MKPHSLDTLRRLRRQELMELNREMQALALRQGELDDQLQSIDQELTLEAAIAENDPFSRFGAYAMRQRSRSDDILRQIDAIDAEIVELHDLIAGAFEAYKTIEQVEHQQIAEQLALEQQRDQALMDEVALRNAGQAMAQ